MSNETHLLILSGPSGSGKTTLCRMVADRLGFYYGISHTTRPRRPDEKDGYDYHFVTRAQFEKMIRQGQFLEWAEVYGNFYGTLEEPMRERLDKGQGIVLDLDTQGATAVRQKIPGAFLVFIEAPSMSDLESRLIKRGNQTDEDRRLRLSSARDEERQKKFYDRVILNRNLETTYQELEKILRVGHDKKRT